MLQTRLLSGQVAELVPASAAAARNTLAETAISSGPTLAVDCTLISAKASKLTKLTTSPHEDLGGGERGPAGTLLPAPAPALLVLGEEFS